MRNIVLPEKFEARMSELIGDEYAAFYDALCDEPIHSGLRINTLKDGAKAAVFAEFGELCGVLWCADGYYADKSVINGRHPYHASGLYYFQEPSAMCAVEALPINEGDMVLDLCAAPGGKSTQAAAKLNGTGMLVANEIVKKRASILSENIERMGITNAVVTNETPQRLSEKFPAFFNKIIVDAPCSGEGMFRKEPQAITEWSEEHTKSCAERQKNIIDSAFKMLKPNGYLVYSTCTFSADENEGVTEYIIEKHKAKLCEIPSLSMLSQGIQGAFKNDMRAARRIFPHRNRGEGHYTALFKAADGDMPPQRQKISRDTISSDAKKMYRDFEREFLNTRLDGRFTLFGSELYLMNTDVDLDKIKVVRPGLHLGTLKKNRFEPAHALALALRADDFKNVCECDLETAQTYLLGNTVPFSGNGWCAAAYNGYPMGWGKASSGVMKNHYPKHLRNFK